MPSDRFTTLFMVSKFWFLAALVLMVGKHQERYEPDRFSFFGLPGWHTPTAYNFFVVAALALGITCMVLAFFSRRFIANHYASDDK